MMRQCDVRKEKNTGIHVLVKKSQRDAKMS